MENMKGVFGLILLASIGSTSVYALKCYQCSSMDPKGSDASANIQQLTKNMTSANDPVCDKHDSAFTGDPKAKSSDCPTPDANHDAFCLKFKGKISFRANGKHVQFTGVRRGCYLSLKSEKERPGCGVIGSITKDLINDVKAARFLVSEDDSERHGCLCDEDNCNGEERPVASFLIVGFGLVTAVIRGFWSV